MRICDQARFKQACQTTLPGCLKCWKFGYMKYEYYTILLLTNFTECTHGPKYSCANLHICKQICTWPQQIKDNCVLNKVYSREWNRTHAPICIHQPICIYANKYSREQIGPCVHGLKIFTALLLPVLRQYVLNIPSPAVFQCCFSLSAYMSGHFPSADLFGVTRWK